MVEVLVPAYNSFLEQYENNVLGLRKDTIAGAAVAEACLHITEYIYPETRIALKDRGLCKLKDYRESLFSRSPEYKYTCGLANAWKHKTLTRPNREIESIVGTDEYFAVVRLRDQEGCYYYGRKVVMVTLSDGRRVELGGLLSLSLALVIDEAQVLGIIPGTPRIKVPKQPYRSRSEVLDVPTIRYIAHKGEPFYAGTLVFVYDEKSGRLYEQTDADGFITEFKVEFEILEEPFTSPSVEENR